MKNDINVLITGAGAATCVTVIKGLRCQKNSRIKIITCDMEPDSAGRYLSDSFHLVPAASDPKFVERLLNICQKENVDLLIPIIDYEFLPIAREKEKFDKLGITVAISDKSAIEICIDKLKTFQFLCDKGLPSPWTQMPPDFENNMKFPVIIKPIIGRATINVYLARNTEEYWFYSKKVDGNFLVQDYMKGQELTIDAISDFNGKYLGCCIRERTEIKAGQSYKGIVVNIPNISELVRHLLESLALKGARGPFCIQGFNTKEGFFFTEINPRFGAATILSIRAGFNSPLALLSLHFGNDPTCYLQGRSGVQMLRFWQELILENGQVLCGEL